MRRQVVCQRCGRGGGTLSRDGGGYIHIPTCRRPLANRQERRRRATEERRAEKRRKKKDEKK